MFYLTLLPSVAHSGLEGLTGKKGDRGSPGLQGPDGSSGTPGSPGQPGELVYMGVTSQNGQSWTFLSHTSLKPIKFMPETPRTLAYSVTPHKYIKYNLGDETDIMF